jgi:hypothetical protein
VTAPFAARSARPQRHRDRPQSATLMQQQVTGTLARVVALLYELA